MPGAVPVFSYENVTGSDNHQKIVVPLLSIPFAPVRDPGVPEELVGKNQSGFLSNFHTLTIINYEFIP